MNANHYHTAKCLAKTRRGRDGAEQFAAALRTKNPGSNAYAYQCQRCGYWHVSCNKSSARYVRQKAKSRPMQKHDRRVQSMMESMEARDAGHKAKD